MYTWWAVAVNTIRCKLMRRLLGLRGISGTSVEAFPMRIRTCARLMHISRDGIIRANNIVCLFTLARNILGCPKGSLIKFLLLSAKLGPFCK